MTQDRKEYMLAYHKAHREQAKAYNEAYHQAHRDERLKKSKAYYKANRDECLEKSKAYNEAHREQRKAYYEAHREECKAYSNTYYKSDVNSKGQTKSSIRSKSNHYLRKYGKKIEGYEIHHCSGYTEPYKFIYCSKEMHNLIHAYLRQHNIDADSNHYEQIKHLLDDSVVLYGIE